jgi:hypothetical protein
VSIKRGEGHLTDDNLRKYIKEQRPKGDRLAILGLFATLITSLIPQYFKPNRSLAELIYVVILFVISTVSLCWLLSPYIKSRDRGMATNCIFEMKQGILGKIARLIMKIQKSDIP